MVLNGLFSAAVPRRKYLDKSHEDLPVSSFAPIAGSNRPPPPRRRRLLYAAVAVLVIVLLIVWNLDFIRFFTRPFIPSKWRRDYQVEINYGFDPASANASCALHGWAPRQRPVRLYDAVLVDFELDLLEIHLDEVYPAVDAIFVVESNVTFTNIPKPMHFRDNQARFARFAEKIVHVAVDDMPSSGGAWKREAHQRHRTSLALAARMQPGDLFMFTDVDEIPRRDTLQMLKHCDCSHMMPLCLKMAFFRYSYEWMVPSAHYDVNVQEYRGAFPGSGRADSAHCIGGGGWHCSWCFPLLSHFVHKLESYSHQEDNLQRNKNLARIQKRICDGSNLFDTWSEHYNFKGVAVELIEGGLRYARQDSLEVAPKFLRDYPGRFAYLTPGHCVRPDGLTQTLTSKHLREVT